MTATRLAIGAAIWLAAATAVGIVTGRCLRLMEDPDE